MKKALLILSLVLGLTVGTYAEGQGSLFNRDGNDQEEMNGNRGMGLPGLPDHDQDDNQNAPLAGGALLLIGFGAAYAMSKKNKD